MLTPGERLVRFYNPKHGAWDRHRSYGPLPDLRFDHHLAPPGSRSDRTVWYAATSLLGAVAEAFGNQGTVDKGSGRRICVAQLLSPLTVVNLVGVAARAFGLDQRIGASLEYERCQEWARALYERYPEIQGIRWRGRQAGSICLVLNDRVDMSALKAVADSDLSHPDFWPRIASAARRANLRIRGPEGLPLPDSHR